MLEIRIKEAGPNIIKVVKQFPKVLFPAAAINGTDVQAISAQIVEHI